MKIQIIYDISPNSTRDVADGMRDALRDLGHEVCATPTHSYSVHFLHPFGSVPPERIPKEANQLIWQTINKLILADAVIFEPDVLIVISGWVMHRYVVEKIKSLGVPAVLYLTESPYMDTEQVEQPSFLAYDLVFCNERASVPFLRQHHGNVAYLPHSYNPAVHRPVAGPAPDCDVFFCGTGFTERRELIKATRWGEARVHLAGFWSGDTSDLNAVVFDNTVPNKELPPIYGAVPINLNIHRTTKTWCAGGPEEEHIAHAESIGPRVYEVLACGGFLATDRRAEMDGFLVDGVHLATFADADGLTDLVRHYLQRSDERARIAEAGRAAVAECTFGRRCEQYVLPAIEKLKGVVTYG